MASAAAVAADQARSPLPNDLGELGEDGKQVTTATLARDEEPADALEEDDDEDDDVQGSSRRKGRVEHAATNGDGDEDGDGGLGDDLFGDDDEEQDAPTTAEKRTLDDEQLDSGDDEGRKDRTVEEEEAEAEAAQPETYEKTVTDMEIPRQSLPDPSDGEMYLMKVPPFMSIEPKEFSHLSFQPPSTDHHSMGPASTAFSAFKTAATTVRWRRSPANPNVAQSNARINRWADGRLTLQLASDPKAHYEIDGNSLAPPQRNTSKPTPNTTQASRDSGSAPTKDNYTYLAVGMAAMESLRVTHRITTGLSVRDSNTNNDDAIEKLQRSLAAAAGATKIGGTGLNLMEVQEDPEKARKEAEVFAREKARKDKKEANAAQRELERGNRALGRNGLTSSRGAGLSHGMLEDEEGRVGGRSKASKPRRRQQRRNSEYSSDEDRDGRGGGRFREDEYDEEDEFIARSDEEEVVEDDDDPDDGIADEPSQQRTGTPKRSRPAAEVDDDADADGEDDDDVQQVKTKRRRIVDEDDEDE